MTVRVRIRYRVSAVQADGRGRMRREFIYPHRSVRFVRITAKRVAVAAITAVVLCGLVAAWSTGLFESHNRLCLTFLGLAGIPVSDVRSVDLFPGLGHAPVPASSVVRVEDNPARFVLLLAASVLLLLAIQRRFPLARGFVIFLLTLLLITAVVASLHPSSQFGSAEFTQIWLRGEVLVWMLLPFFVAGIFTLVHPFWVVGVIWTVAIQAFGVLWSAVRLAFCIGVMHYSGILFIPMLWFALGMLADVVYLIVSYSIAVHWNAARCWGRRAG